MSQTIPLDLLLIAQSMLMLHIHIHDCYAFLADIQERAVILIFLL